MKKRQLSERKKIMAYLCTAVALLCLTVKGYCGKKTGTYVRNTGDSFLFNFVRMLFCVVIGMLLILIGKEHGQLAVEGRMLAICFFTGAANAAFLAGWLLAIQKNTMVTVDVSLTVGSLIPAVLCAICFGDAILPQKLFGFGLIILATVILSGYNKSAKGKGGLGGALLLVIAAAGDGLTGFCQQLYNRYYTESGTLCRGVTYSNSIYHFYTYLFAALILLAVFLLYRVWQSAGKSKEEKRQARKEILSGLRKPMPHIAIMAVCLFVASYFQTVATGALGMPSQVMYPVIKGGCLITVNLTAMLFFGEKPTGRSILGSAVALGGIVAMSLL